MSVKRSQSLSFIQSLNLSRTGLAIRSGIYRCGCRALLHPGQTWPTVRSYHDELPARISASGLKSALALREGRTPLRAYLTGHHHRYHESAQPCPGLFSAFLSQYVELALHDPLFSPPREPPEYLSNHHDHPDFPSQSPPQKRGFPTRFSLALRLPVLYHPRESRKYLRVDLTRAGYPKGRNEERYNGQ